jgi:hypothetical protein
VSADFFITYNINWEIDHGYHDQFQRCTLIKTAGHDGWNAQAGQSFKELTDATIQPGLHRPRIFMASAGWWVLIDVQKTCKRNRGELALACIQSGISDSLKLVGMDSYFSTFDDVTGAVGNF